MSESKLRPSELTVTSEGFCRHEPMIKVSELREWICKNRFFDIDAFLVVDADDLLARFCGGAE